MPEDSIWRQEENTLLAKNTAFGKILFDVEESVGEAQYMRIAKDYSESHKIDKLKHLFNDFWKLEEPGNFQVFIFYYHENRKLQSLR